LGIKKFLFIRIDDKYKISVLLLPFLLCMALTGNLFKYLLFMFFALVHELAHIAAAFAFKAKFKGLTVYAAGFSASVDLYNLNDKEMFFVYSAGIATNLTFALLFFILSAALKTKSLFINDIILMNVMMFVTNILPMKPLDGSHILKLLLQRYTGYIKSEKIIVKITIVLLPILFALSIIQLVSHIFNVSLLLISTYIFLSYNQVDSEVFYMIYRSYQNKMKKIESGEAYEVREMIVNENATVFDVYKRMDKDKYHMLKVCDKNFRIINTVSEKKVIDCIMNGNIDERMKNLR
jgi:stage IV sporulation protein FB